MGEALNGDMPPIVLLHAAGLDRRMWDGVAAALTGLGHDVRAVDLMGHGDAPAPPAGFSLVDLADDLADRLPTEPAVLAGVSLGGMVAQLCAVRHEARVAGLVLANTMAAPSPQMREVLESRGARTQQLGMAGMLDETIERWFPAAARATLPGVVSDVRGWLGEADTTVNAGTWRAIARLDVMDELAGLGVPALVLSGGADASVPAAITKEMCAALPDVRHVEFAGAGHLVPLEVPDRFVAEVDEFVRSTIMKGGRP
ncbi:MAG: alpha/beta fold hydrolase [Streptosporangiales bacterium]|nr:alpha/beta fold hydrolase [Streptosporangiales bacterium]MBO0891567.1 alpha/beta fold hydrolase [Acidothermales bacterium]